MDAPRSIVASTYLYLQSRLGRHARIARRFIRSHGLTVSGGPFTGLTYTRRTAAGRIVAKLVGAYEAEVHASLMAIIRAEPRLAVNIGSAEGYYAVGLARLVPDLVVHAFETDDDRRSLCAELARANGVGDRVIMHGSCTQFALAKVPGTPDLVICDCEGYERELLRPDLVPWLARATLLVELHDALMPGTREALLERFAPTHRIEVIGETPRDASRYRALDGMAPSEATEALDEYRRDRLGRPLSMQWAIMTPLS
jgi:predicted O-methyltransferase YrrM